MPWRSSPNGSRVEQTGQRGRAIYRAAERKQANTETGRRKAAAGRHRQAGGGRVWRRSFDMASVPESLRRPAFYAASLPLWLAPGEQTVKPVIQMFTETQKPGPDWRVERSPTVAGSRFRHS